MASTRIDDVFRAMKYDDVPCDLGWVLNSLTGAVENENMGVYVKHLLGKLPRELAASLHKYNDYTHKQVHGRGSKMAPRPVTKGETVHVGVQNKSGESTILDKYVIATDVFEHDRKIVTVANCFQDVRKLRCGTPVWSSSDNFVSPITQALHNEAGTFYAVSCYENMSWTFSAEYELVLQYKTKQMVCGDREFDSREELIQYQNNLPAEKKVCVWLKRIPGKTDYTGLQISVIDGRVESLNCHYSAPILGYCNIRLSPSTASTCSDNSYQQNLEEVEDHNDIDLRFGNVRIKRKGWKSCKVHRNITDDVGSDYIEGPPLDIKKIFDGDEIVFQHKPDTKLVNDIVRQCIGTNHKNVTLYFPNGHNVNFSQVFGYQDGTSLLHKMSYQNTSQATDVPVDEIIDRMNHACNLCCSAFNIIERIQIHDCDLDTNMKLANALMFLGLEVVMAKVSIEQLSIATDLDNVQSHNDKVKQIVTSERDGILDEWTKHEYHHGIVNNWNITDCASKFKSAVSRLFGGGKEPHNSVVIENGNVEITNRDAVGVAEVRFGLINRGNAGICDGTVSTNYHNTNGKDLHVMQKGHEVTLKVVYQDAEEDVAVFKTLRNYKKPEHGKVYLAIGYHENDKPSVYPMLCAYSSGKTDRALFLPCNLVNDAWEVVEGYSWYGFSVGPIFDLDGEQVGMFGRGFVLNNMQDSKPGVVMSASTLPAQKGVQEKVFSEAATIISSEKPPEGKRGFLIVASTGAGKTMRLTRNSLWLYKASLASCLFLLDLPAP